MTPAERREARDDLRSEIEEIDADLEGWKCEIEDAEAAITDAKILIAEATFKRKTLVARRNELKTTKAPAREG